MAEEKVMISQDELSRMLTVFSNVHKDNDENERGTPPANMILSQVEVDTVFEKGVRKPPKADGDGIIKPATGQNMDEAAQIRAMKIAARKAHSAQILAQVNACSPKRIQVSYGSCLKKNIDIEKLKEGDVVELDRKISEEVKVFVDGRLFAKGVLGEKAGVATVKLTNLSPRTAK